MKICIVHQYFKTPKTGGAIRSYYIAKYLKSKGHEVTVITAGNEGYYTIDENDGFNVHYLPVYYENHLGFLSRIHAFILFAWKAYRMIKKLKPFDINYVITTPLTTGFIALRAKRKLNIPYVFEVGDIWPEAPIQLGVLKNPLLISLAQYFEKKFYKNSRSLVALSPDIKEYIASVVPEKQIEVITNFSDAELLEDNYISTKYDQWTDKFVISYIGTVGLANHLEFLITAAENVQNDKVQFIIAGGGAQYSKIHTMAIERGLKNVAFLDKTDKKGVAEILTITDAVYISFDNVPILSSGCPNKFFDGLATGKIIIINFKGWIKELVESNDCGFYYDPIKPEDFGSKLLPYLKNKEFSNNSKKRARSLSSQFTPAKQLENIDRLINTQ